MKTLIIAVIVGALGLNGKYSDRLADSPCLKDIQKIVFTTAENLRRASSL